MRIHNLISDTLNTRLEYLPGNSHHTIRTSEIIYNADVKIITKYVWRENGGGEEKGNVSCSHKHTERSNYSKKTTDKSMKRVTFPIKTQLNTHVTRCFS